MKTDRELLELAARAAGYVIERCPQWCGGSGGYMKTVIPAPVDPVLSTSLHWNPLVDDGDSLRLLVNLGLEIYEGSDEAGVLTGVVYFVGSGSRPKVAMEYHNNHADPYSAARRAITRAAAQMQLYKEQTNG